MKPREQKPRTELRRIGKKRQAEFDAAGERAFSTFKKSERPKRKPGAPGPMMQRRSKPAKARKPISRVNAKRAAKNRERAYGTKRDWIIAQPCAVCGYSAGPCDPAHAKGEGASLKSSSRFLVPLCPVRPIAQGDPTPFEGCHRESHRIGVQSFETKHGVNLLDLAERYEAEWQALQPSLSRVPDHD